ncbi:MAG: HAD family hydrolase [Lysobacterales bacterium]
MTRIFLFDWGNTLMVDIPGQVGKMRDWPEVKAVDGAAAALERLSRECTIYVATNAIESHENDIKAALERVGLAQYISGYFCRANVGIGKGSQDYYQAIVDALGIEADEATMVGDSYQNDIAPALQAGLNAIWLRPGGDFKRNVADLRVITNLRELCTP